MDDPFNTVSYVELNKRRRGDTVRRDGDKLINRISRPKVKKIYLKRIGEPTHVKPKMYVWRQWQSPKLEQLLEDIGPYVGLDDGAEGIYTIEGEHIIDPDDIVDFMTYYVSGIDDDYLLNNQNTIDDYWPDKDHQRHTSLSAPEFITANSVRSTYPMKTTYPPTPPPRPYTGDGTDRGSRKSKQTFTYLDQYDDYFNDAINFTNNYVPTTTKSPASKRTNADDMYIDNPQTSDFDTSETLQKDRQRLERHKQKLANKSRRYSAMIFNRRDQTNPDAYIIYVFLNGQGMSSQYMNFQRKQLEKGMSYVLELIARRYNVNPSRLVDMDGKRISDVTQLMSRGAYVLIPAGQRFRDTWYFLPDNAIDTSSNHAMIEERSAQRDRLLQRRQKREISLKSHNKGTRSKSENALYREPFSKTSFRY